MASSTTFCDLEIRILDAQQNGYPVEITLDSEQEFPRGFLDPSFLPWAATADPETDGRRLFNWLFEDEKIKLAWTEARGRSPQRRIRLRIDAGVPELHALPWESLRESNGSDLALAASRTTPFSRYLAGKWDHGEPVLEDRLRILVAIANPEGLETFGLGAIDVEDELRSLDEAISTLNAEMVILPQPCTLSALEGALRDGVHILHFIGHGLFDENMGTALLLLADADNQIRQVEDTELTRMFQGLIGDGSMKDPLQLVFLASCETAKRSPADAFRGLAPRLVTTGIPAVLAMQGLAPMVTANAFARTFYAQVLQHGLVDLATNEARAAITTAALPGASIPVLFMRLRAGKLFDLGSGFGIAPIDLLPYEPETVLVPAGVFPMGSNEESEDEAPRHEVDLPAFRMGVHPVTNRQYAEFLQRELEVDPPKKSGWFLREAPEDRLDFPVTGVSWHEAIAYCVWLSEQSGRRYRLPSEAEWEKAARGSEGRIYPWGNTWEDGRCNVAGDDVVAVASFVDGVSANGCHDLLGNVQEWTNSLWGSNRTESDFRYPYRADDGREEDDVEQHMHRVYRVYRGGSYRDDAGELTSARRACSGPGSKIRWRGFRVAMDIGSPSI